MDSDKAIFSSFLEVVLVLVEVLFGRHLLLEAIGKAFTLVQDALDKVHCYRINQECQEQARKQ